MSTPNPDHRAVYLLEVNDPQADEHEEALCRIRWGVAGPHDGAVEWALSKYKNRLSREILQAFIIARATNLDINKWLRIPEDVMRAYRHLFFDLSVFRDELDAICWVHAYSGSVHGKNLLNTAMTCGLDTIIWAHSRGEALVDARTIQAQGMTDAYHRGKAHRGKAITSPEAVAALAFMNSAIKSAQIAERSADPDGGGILLKLKYRDTTEKITDVALQGEILH